MSLKRTKEKKLKNVKHSNRYTQREWDRVVGYGKVPEEYSHD